MEFIRRNVNGQSTTTSGGNGGGINNLSSNSAVLASHTIFSLPFDGTNDVRGDIADANNITANGTISTDRGFVIKGVDDEGAYTDKNLEITKGDQTDFKGGESYHFDKDVYAPKFVGDIDAENATIETLTATNAEVTEKLTAANIEAVYAYIQELLSDKISVDTLTVTKAAHFFSLIIDEVKSVGGQIIITPANATIDMVKKTSSGNYKCYFRAKVGDHQITNSFAANDQVVCQTFNAAEGTSYDVSNTFYWRLVMSRGKETIDDVDYHFILLSGTDCAEDSGEPQAGDMIAQLGNRNTADRQNAIVLSAYNSEFLDKGLKAPSLVQYKGINDYNLTTHRYNVISNGFNEFRGNLKVEAGTDVEDLIEGVKYDKIILDKGTAIVDASDKMTLTLSGSILVNSSETFNLELLSDIASPISLPTRNNTFSYSKTISNYSTLTSKPTYYTLQLRQGDTIIEKANIQIVFEAGAIFEVKEDAITSAVSSVSGDISRIEQKADSVTSTVANLKVGGTNLLDDTEFNTFPNAADTTWMTKNGSCTKGYGYMNLLGVHAISNPSTITSGGYMELLQQKLSYKLKPNTEYTFSFYAKGSDGSGYYISDGLRARYNYKGRITTYVYPDVGAEGYSSDCNKTFILNGTWQRYSYTFKTKADLSISGEYKLLFRLITSSTDTNTYYSNAYICMPKLEEGNVPTAWDTSYGDVKSIIQQTADSIEAKIIDEDEIKSLISLEKGEIKAEVYNEINEATGINITDGSITLNADKTTIKGNLNITDTQNGLTVYETAEYNGKSTLIPRINLQPKLIADIAEMALDTYTFYNKSIYQTNNSNWSLDFASLDYEGSKDDTITLDKFYLREIRSNSSGTQNPPYSTTCKLIIKMYLVADGSAVELERKEYILSKADNNGKYTSNDIARFAIPQDGTYRFLVSSSLNQTALANYPIMTANASMRVLKASRAITYVGTDGMYCHSGANKCLFVNEKETIIQHGFNGVKWDNSDVNGNKAMKVVTGVSGVTPYFKPVWFPFYNYTPIFKPTNPTSAIRIVNDGNSYDRYAYKINPENDCGICYIESSFMNTSLLNVETWILLPPSYFLGEDGTYHSLPVGYTICVINGGFGSDKFTAYVSADVSKSHLAVFIDGHRDKNWKVSLNNEVHWERFMYVGSYYSSDCSDNQDIWMTLGDAL